MTLPYGVDISRHQYSADGKQKVNFAILNPLIAFIGIRAAISWGYTDPWFAYSWASVTAPRLAYHVTYPGEDAIRQMAHFLRIVNPGEHDRLVLDLELDHGYSKYQITQTVLACLEHLRSATGRYPIIYSRASWINDHLNVSDLPDNLDWWLATYLTALPAPAYTPEHPGPPWLPVGSNTWLIHQTGDRGNGSAHGVASHYVDQNRWNGTEDEMLSYFGLKEESHEVYLPIITRPEPEPETEPEKPLYKAVVKNIAPVRLKVRPEPGSSKVVRQLKAGEKVDVYQEFDRWARIGDREWFNDRYLQKVVEKDERNLLPIPLWAQRDPRWEGLKMGNSGITIGQQGCLVTDTSACLSLILGREITPLGYGTLLNSGPSGSYGYLNPTNRMYWQIPSLKYGVPLEIFKAFPSGRGWENTVRSMLAKGLPAMGRVDMIPGAGYLQHWVTFLGESNGVFFIHDPWYGNVAALTARYDKVFHISAYGKP